MLPWGKATGVRLFDKKIQEYLITSRRRLRESAVLIIAILWIFKLVEVPVIMHRD
jgi:hypothetical protein